MERKRRLLSRILTCCIVSISASACQYELDNIEEDNSKETITLEFRTPEFITKSTDPRENDIHDINLLIFQNGVLEYKEWFNTDPLGTENKSIKLIKGRKYSFYILANYGSQINASDWEELKKLKLDIGSTKRLGLLMSGVLEDRLINGQETVVISLTRMEAKISLKIDRSKLSDGINMTVYKVSIGNSVKYMNTIGPNKAKNKYDCVNEGYTLSKMNCRELNEIMQGGMSDEVVLYLPENLQGNFPEDIEKDSEKVFHEGDARADVCSFIQLEFGYNSNENFSINGSNLIYRFYLGENRQNLDVERNCHYHITVTPKDSGLSGDGWRVDKTGIGKFVRQIILSEQQCKLTYKGQQNLLEAEVFPSDATYKDLIWESSNPQIATVQYDGTVTAVSEGECDIICYANDNSGIQTSCKVLVKFAPPSFNIYPGNYISGKVGESIHIWCEFFPPYAPFDIGYEELNYDKGRGIYDYTVDKDGHGVTLKLKKAGTGLLYMSAGDPVNESGLVIVEVKS